MEIKIMRFQLITSFFIFCCSFVFSQTNNCILDSGNKIKIDADIYKMLDGEQCKIINYKKQKYLFVYTNGMVNQCGILLYSKQKDIYNNYMSKEELCNVKIYNDILVHSYRDRARWYYKYYRINNTSIDLIFGNKSNITPKTLTTYNNIAYYLQKAGANEEAVFLLEKIIEKFPSRTVAYYNLGDAYWALGEKQKAMKAYTTYIEQMCQKGLQKKIPKVVLKRIEIKK